MSAPFVLIVDDDDVIRSLLRFTLPDDGYELVEARNGDEALRLASQQAPALVLLDWRMPGASGEVVLTSLKRSHPGVPVIVLTADPEAEVRALAESLGADVFMSKPFSPLQLLAAVETLLPDRLPDEAP